MAKPVVRRGQYIANELGKLLPLDDDGNRMPHVKFAKAPTQSLVLTIQTIALTIDAENQALRELAATKEAQLQALREISAEMVGRK